MAPSAPEPDAVGRTGARAAATPPSASRRDRDGALLGRGPGGGRAPTARRGRAPRVGEVVDAAVAAHPELARVAAVASFLLDGRAVGREEPVPDGGDASRCCRPSPGGDAQWRPCLRTTRPCASPAPTAPTPRCTGGRRVAPVTALARAPGASAGAASSRRSWPRWLLLVAQDSGYAATLGVTLVLALALAWGWPLLTGSWTPVATSVVLGVACRGHRAERPARGPAVGACRRGVRHRPRVRRPARPADGPRGPRPHAARRRSAGSSSSPRARRRSSPPTPTAVRPWPSRPWPRSRLPSSRTCSPGVRVAAPLLGFVALVVGVLAAASSRHASPRWARSRRSASVPRSARRRGRSGGSSRWSRPC